MAVSSWNIAPSEFWELSPTEFWIIYNGKLPPKMYGKMTEAEVDDLIEMMEERGGEEARNSHRAYQGTAEGRCIGCPSLRKAQGHSLLPGSTGRRHGPADGKTDEADGTADA